MIQEQLQQEQEASQQRQIERWKEEIPKQYTFLRGVYVVLKVKEQQLSDDEKMELLQLAFEYITAKKLQDSNVNTIFIEYKQTQLSQRARLILNNKLRGKEGIL